MRIKDISKWERPRERLKRLGCDVLERNNRSYLDRFLKNHFCFLITLH